MPAASQSAAKAVDMAGAAGRNGKVAFQLCTVELRAGCEPGVRVLRAAGEDRPVLAEGQVFGPDGGTRGAGGGVVLHIGDLEQEAVQPEGGQRALANLLLQCNSELRALYRACW